MGNTHAFTVCNFMMAMKHWLERWLLAVWYGNKPLAKYLLLPLTGLFCVLRYWQLAKQQRRQVKHAVPIIVVGNITVGGTGKTPIVIWLVQQLQQLGFRPAVVSRGFGSQGKTGLVQATDDATQVGDEPLLIQRRTRVPVCVNRQRNQAITELLQTTDCNVVIADDGMQHYQMGRDLELCIVDAQRGFGNGFCLPAGPLREPQSRLQHCDVVLRNGADFQVAGEVLHNLCGSATQPLSQLQGQTVHVVTGIGNPQRFQELLAQFEIEVHLHAFADHYHFHPEDLIFADDLAVLMTEKDAVKCFSFARQNCWYLPVNAVLDEAITQTLRKHLQGLKHG